MNRETYIRAHHVAFTIHAQDWPEAEAAEWAGHYLETHVRSMPLPGLRALHAALLDERQHPEAAPAPDHAEAIRDIRDHEGRAVLFAYANWLIRPTTGSAIRLCPAGDASGGEE